MIVNIGTVVYDFWQSENLIFIFNVIFPPVGSTAVELEWTVGPIPVADGYGREVISKFTSELVTGGEELVCFVWNEQYYDVLQFVQ